MSSDSQTKCKTYIIKVPRAYKITFALRRFARRSASGQMLGFRKRASLISLTITHKSCNRLHALDSDPPRFLCRMDRCSAVVSSKKTKMEEEKKLLLFSLLLLLCVCCSSNTVKVLLYSPTSVIGIVNDCPNNKPQQKI